ncbi:MAG: amino acid-binding protein [Desulfuromonas sp.]|nr:MAG: amino acid-binding protein [Desulfuromonas sp.]
MAKRFIMTAFGKDRPGIVADVTRILYDNGCNLEDNSMTLLADEFTLMLLFSAPADAEETLQMECRRLEREKGISAFMRPLPERLEPADASGAPVTLHVEGMDQAGIVYQVSQHLADRGVNIIDLKSTVRATPESGTALYIMDIETRVPKGMSSKELEDGLGEVSDALHVDISLTM